MRVTPVSVEADRVLGELPARRNPPGWHLGGEGRPPRGPRGRLRVDRAGRGVRRVLEAEQQQALAEDDASICLMTHLAEP